MLISNVLKNGTMGLWTSLAGDPVLCGVHELGNGFVVAVVDPDRVDFP